MNASPNSLPFSQKIQAREDEEVALKALFEKVFYGTPFSPPALEALSKIRFRAGELNPLTPDTTRYILLNRGETGIGKTRIFRQFRLAAAERRIPVYEIHCYDVEGIPFKPFLLVIREILRDFELSETLREKYRHALESLLPGVFPRRAGGSPSPEPAESGGVGSLLGSEADKIRIFDSLTQLLFEITAFKPVVILVHDLHNGDQATIELLRYIGRNLLLRNARLASGPSRHEARGDFKGGTLPKPTGPELGDDEGEWRELTSRASRESPELVHPAEEGLDPDSLEGRDGRPVRMMVLANYRGFQDESHYLERALRSLGQEPFAFHGEVRTFTQEESLRFIERSLQDAPAAVHGAAPGGQPVSCPTDAAELIHRYSEGFPSYIHELLRLVFLGNAAIQTIDLPLLTRVLGDVPAGSPPRLRIIARRLEGLAGPERRVLQALALARKPLPADFLREVLDPERPVEEMQDLLDGLVERFFLEKVRHEYPRREEEAGYYFRIADFAQVAAEEAAPEERRRIHQRISEECRRRMGQEGDEKAFEVFHHLKRGETPASAVEYGLLAAGRFTRSFSLRKALQVCEELLEILPSPAAGGGSAAPAGPPAATGGRAAAEAPAAPAAVRRQVLERTAFLHLRLKDHQEAEKTLTSLLEEGKESLQEAERLDLLLQLAEVARSAGDTARTMKVVTKAFRLLREENHCQAARLHLAMARAHLDRQDAKRAINFCLNGLKILKNHPEVEEWADLHALLARAHCLRPDYTHAVDHFQRALESLERRRPARAGTADVLDDLGRVYLERGNYFRAARYLYKSLEIKRREQDILGLSRSYDELGRVYLRTGDEIKTLEHLHRSLHLKERVGDLAGLNPTLGILGDLYFRLGQFQKAIRYFKREVDNSQLLSETRGLVDAFLHLGWVHLELGELKQVESLCKQISILAGEFKLKAQEAEGARLWGSLEALERSWNGAEKHLRQAIEMHSKLGDRRREVQSLLGLADIKYNRELYDESLKLASKGLVLAEELKAQDLQAQAHLIKGNIYRFLKGGSAEKAKELLRRALELGQPLNEAVLLFNLFYSLAKVYHYDREFAEAGNFYGKAEAILRRVADGLPEDMAARFFEDRRRKLFFEDAARFRKEVQSRQAPGAAIEVRDRPAASDLREKPVGLQDYKDLTARLLRIHGGIGELDFPDRLLAEALELVKAERGLLLRVQNRQYQVAAAVGFGTDPGTHPEFPSAQSLGEEAARRGRTIVCSGADDEERLGKLLRLSAPIRRAVLAAPILTAERIFGGLYLDRPLSMGGFSPRDLVMGEAFASHSGCAFENRRQYETAIQEPLTGFYTPTYFLERVKDAFRWFNLHGKPFHLLGFHLPSLEESISGGGGLGEKVASELAGILPRNAAASWWNPVLAVLLQEGDLAAVEASGARIAEQLGALLKEDVEHRLMGPESRYPDGTTLYYELRRSLLPEECDAQTITEIRRLLARDITLKEAKRILEKHIIESTLRKTGGNITHAAKELGIHRPQLSNLLKKYALKRELYERDLDIRLNPLDN